jgi:hypothetical protein
MHKLEENYIEHEVRIRLQEERNTDFKNTLNKIEERFIHMDNKMTNQFYWILGTILAITLALTSYLIVK